MLDKLGQFYSKQDAMKPYEAMNTHMLDSKQDAMKISEAKNIQYNQISDKQQKILIDSFTN